MQTSTVNIEQIKECLARHRGSIKTAASTAGVTREMVRLVLNGERKSAKVLGICAQVAFDFELQELEARKRINEIVKKIDASSMEFA